MVFFAHHVLLSRDKQVRLGVIVRALLPGTAGPEVEGVGKQGPRQSQASDLGPELHLVKDALGHRVPGLIVLNMAVVGMVSAVADAPAMVGDQDGGVYNVANKVIEGPVVREALVSAAVHGEERSLVDT